VVEEVRRALMEGRCCVPAVGSVIAGVASCLPFVVVDADGREVEPVSAYLRDLVLGDVSPLTCRSYGFGLLRWHRLLWLLEISWEKATEADVAVLVGWLREARNPQRVRRRNGSSAPPGSVNLKTGKPSLREGYAPATINHNLTVVSGFYAFHGRFGAGPVLNPVPVSRERRQVLAHRSPLEAAPVFRRGRLRQKVPAQAPRSIPDQLWDKLSAVMGCDRDRALLEFYVSSGARASELLGVCLDDIDWPGQLIYVVSKGTRIRQPVPASPNAFRYLGRYLAAVGLPTQWPARLARPRRCCEAADVLGDAARSAESQRQARHELDLARRPTHGRDQDGRRRPAHPRRSTDNLAACASGHYRPIPHCTGGGLARQAPGALHPASASAADVRCRL